MSEETEDIEKENENSAEQGTSEQDDGESGAASQSFLFKGAIEVFPFDEYPELSSAGLKVCRARGKKGEDLFAVFCDKSLFPRVESVSKYNSLQGTYMARLIASGVTDLSKETKQLLPEQAYLFLFEDMFGAPLLKKGEPQKLALKPEIVRYTILPSLVSVLQDLKQSDLVHGALHAGNIFLPKGTEVLTSSEGVNGVYVGECLSLPFSYSMPLLYLPVGRSAVPATARGQGVFEDEIYSLGVLLSVLLRKTDPCEGMTDDEIITSKIEQGSYQTIVGDNRIDVFFLNALRGMLQDDPGQRWTLEDVLNWADGQRVGPKQGGVKRLNANRPLPFAGKKYLRPEVLSFEFHDNVDDAYQLITGGELEKWIDRSVANPALKSHLKLALDAADKYGQKVGYMERRVAQVALMLNNSSPIFYKNIKFLPDGLGASFGHDAIQGEDLTPYAEVIEMNLLPFWLEHQESKAVDVATLSSSLEACKMSLKQSGFGYGVERCIYLLCEDAPCLSPALSGYYVKTPEDLFLALNDMSLSGDMPDRVVDRHIAAFLSVRDRQMIDGFMIDINSKIPHVSAMAILKMLATIQYKSGMDKAVGLSTWVVEKLSKPLLERFHDREMRKKALKQLRRMAGTGDIMGIAALFETDSVLKEDKNAYILAMQKYQSLLKQEDILSYNLEHNKRYGQGRGREVASIVSITISFLIVMVTLFLFFGEKLVGG